VAAFIGVELDAHRFPARIPDSLAVLDKKVTAVVVERHVIIAVAGQAPKAGVGVESVAAGGIGNQREKLRVPQIVDPGIRRARRIDYIFPVGIIKVSEFSSQFQANHRFPAYV